MTAHTSETSAIQKNIDLDTAMERTETEDNLGKESWSWVFPINIWKPDPMG